ncbi:MAG: SGNH/GDSL hydrolase family protein [Ruminococcus sp.]|uniref:SGNH/GDSL hydrolase family protein n=1 Tax=Ruminococcus sp. TaxID=41978 RepID=UPI002873B441|nr:SGNH/GDSL hydrolase family protein [Ruminococcus sp.]MBQ3284241.1 SGNH/GDSL hydrolase family protein [Ruminococcus sp.]
MRERFTKKHWISALIIAVLVTIVLSVSIVSAIAKNVGTKPQSVRDSALATPDAMGDKMLNERIYTTTHNRSRWLFDLMNRSGKAKLSDSSDPQKIFEAAAGCGILSGYTEDDMYQPLTRLFVAQTTVKALGYKQRSAGWIADVNAMQSAMSTMAYYGYFLPDVNAMVHPDREITAEEYEDLLVQLDRYAQLKGKTILTFGDSIMHGSGNNDEGIGDMIAEKYGMTAVDYSVPGAAMGDRYGRGQIISQIPLAVRDKVKPDIILINGGTNDMYSVPIGEFTEGYDMTNTSTESFTGGFEKTMWYIQRYWSSVPAVFIRAHNMDIGADENEKLYGERELAVANKWGATWVDLYENTDMNTEDSYTCGRYTYIEPALGNIPDSVHPNALGYAKFYLPPISQEIMKQLVKE